MVTNTAQLTRDRDLREALDELLDVDDAAAVEVQDLEELGELVGGAAGRELRLHLGGLGVRVSKIGKIAKNCKLFLQIFSGLVLGCIKTKFCKKICVRQHFSSSTRCAYFCTAAISKVSQKIGLKNQQFL